MTAPADDRLRGGRALGWACLLALVLAGCVETGDFGRVKPSVWNDIVASILHLMTRHLGQGGRDWTLLMSLLDSLVTLKD